ncbi:MAG TPA: FAD-dependent oxidoreductase, partial [Patescibacteria group bacterium]|nr:FAD-dependent oxidoreductase [Patescibacteria group bacterium]
MSKNSEERENIHESENQADYHKFDPYTKKPLIEYYEEPKKKTPIVGDYDVLVVGGSQTGVTAAIAAARQGMEVMLVERFGFLGGQSIYSMVVQWEKRGFINNLGAVTTKGIPKEIKDRIIKRGGSDGLWKTEPGCEEMRGGEEWLNPEAIKVTLIEMCQEEGIELLFHTTAVDTIVQKNKGVNDSRPKATGVIFENKSGRFGIKANAIIDATADLDIIWKAIGEKGCGLRDPKNR